jgi:hypothetical protein
MSAPFDKKYVEIGSVVNPFLQIFCRKADPRGLCRIHPDASELTASSAPHAASLFVEERPR